MALQTAYDIIYSEPLAALRGQVGVAVWAVARDQLAGGVAGRAREHAVRVLTAPGAGIGVDLAIWTVATDPDIQATVSAGQPVDGDTLTSLLAARWDQMAAIIAGDLTQVTDL